MDLSGNARALRPATIKLFFISLLLSAISLAPVASAGETRRVPIEELDGSIPQLMAEHHVPGLSIAVIENGDIVWSKGFGTLTKGGDTPVDADTIFEAASLSKTIFANVFLHAVDAGKVGLDRPVFDIAPYDRLTYDPRGAQITPRQVLSHGTGLPNWERKKHNIPFKFDPGTGFGYSGEGFVFLQHSFEKLEGRGLQALASKVVFEPLSMKRSGYLWRPEFADNIARGHDSDGNVQELRHYDTENAAYSLYTTANDYIRFVHFLMQGGGLKPATQKQVFAHQNYMRGNETATQRPKEIWGRIFWGLSWGIQEGNEPIYWHWGDNDTYRSFVAINPTTKNAFVYFTNAPGGLFFVDEIAEPIVGDLSATITWLGYSED